MENIHVAIRLRPLNEKERQRKEEIIWSIHSPNQIAIQPKLLPELTSNLQQQKQAQQPVHTQAQQQKQNIYSYDYSFSQLESNQQVYEKSVKKIVMSSLNGINGSIFMYGQSGSGKTYTMMGYDKMLKLQQQQ